MIMAKFRDMQEQGTFHAGREYERKIQAKRIAELEHKSQLQQITIAEALEECIGENIVKATEILEQALKG
jgi:hypothetical protein